jgi:hypothetical protein
MAGSTLRGRRLLVLALLLGLGLAGAVGFQVWKRRQPIRPFATFLLPSMGELSFADESTLVAFLRGEAPDVLLERVYSIRGGTAALVTESAFRMPSERYSVVSGFQRALVFSGDENVVHVRSLPAFQELASIKLDPELRAIRVIPLSERRVAVICHHSGDDSGNRAVPIVVDDSGNRAVPIVVEVYDVQDGSLVGKVALKDLEAEIGAGNVFLVADQDPYLDRDGDRLHLLLVGGFWVEWSLAASRATHVRRLSFLGDGLGLSSEGELLLAQPRGTAPRDRVIGACPPDDEGKEPRRIAPGLSIPGSYPARDLVLVSPSGDRIVIETDEPQGGAFAVEVATSRRWRLVPEEPLLGLKAGAFSPSGERVALLVERGGQAVSCSVELFQLPP